MHQAIDIGKKALKEVGMVLKKQLTQK